MSFEAKIGWALTAASGICAVVAGWLAGGPVAAWGAAGTAFGTAALAWANINRVSPSK